MVKLPRKQREHCAELHETPDDVEATEHWRARFYNAIGAETDNEQQSRSAQDHYDHRDNIYEPDRKFRDVRVSPADWNRGNGGLACNNHELQHTI